MELPFIGDAQWEATVIRAPGPVMVEFVREGCPHCRAMEPLVQRLAAEYAGRVPFYRVNVEADPDLVWAYQVMSTPTFVVFRDSDPVGELAGEVDEVELRALVEDALAGGG